MAQVWVLRFQPSLWFVALEAHFSLLEINYLLCWVCLRHQFCYGPISACSPRPFWLRPSCICPMPLGLHCFSSAILSRAASSRAALMVQVNLCYRSLEGEGHRIGLTRRQAQLLGAGLCRMYTFYCADFTWLWACSHHSEVRTDSRLVGGQDWSVCSQLRSCTSHLATTTVATRSPSC